MPLIRNYPQAVSLQPTDAFVIDRVGTGTMFIEEQNAGGSSGATASAFRLFLNNDQTIPTNNGYSNNGGLVVKFDQIDLDTDAQCHLTFAVPSGGGPQAAFYNPQSCFVCTKPGWWQFSLTIILKHGPGTPVPYPSSFYTAEMNHYNPDGTFIEQFDTYSGYQSLQPVTAAAQSLLSLPVSQLVRMNIGEIMAPGGGRGPDLTQPFVILGGYNTYFSGFLVRAA